MTPNPRVPTAASLPRDCSTVCERGHAGVPLGGPCRSGRAPNLHAEYGQSRAAGTKTRRSGWHTGRAVRRRSVAPALFLAAWLAPLAAQAAVLVHLLADREAHPRSMVQLLVHGHLHGEQVPEHEHAIQEGPPASAHATARPHTAPRAASALPAGPAEASPAPGLATASLRAVATAPPRHLLFGVLLR